MRFTSFFDGKPAILVLKDLEPFECCRNNKYMTVTLVIAHEHMYARAQLIVSGGWSGVNI